MNRRSQTSTEYLIIIAVVIIIALIVVAVLSGIPSIGGGTKKNAKLGYWKSAEIGVSAIAVGAAIDSVSGGGNGSITIVNNKGDTISITNVTLTDVSRPAGIAFNDTPMTLASGESVSFGFNNLSNSGIAGETYSYYLSITYSDTNTNAIFTFDGARNLLEGEIASALN